MSNIEYAIEMTHINDLKVGDVVQTPQGLKTVGKADLKYGGFMGTTLWGDCHRLGHQLIPKANILRAHPSSSQAAQSSDRAAEEAGGSAAHLGDNVTQQDDSSSAPSM